METSTETKQISKALHKFQGMVHAVAKDSKNPHFKNSYASLEAVWNAARGPLQDCGLVVIQAPSLARGSGLAAVTTRIEHAESGEYMQTTLELPLQKNDPQGAGSAITYACRYSLMSMLGLPPTDDDANAASERYSDQWSDKRNGELQRAVAARPDGPPEGADPIKEFIKKVAPELLGCPTPEKREAKELVTTARNLVEAGGKPSDLAELHMALDVKTKGFSDKGRNGLHKIIMHYATQITERDSKLTNINGG